MVTIFQKLDIYIIPYVDHNLFMVNYLFDKTNIIWTVHYFNSILYIRQVELWTLNALSAIENQ